jgi:hypothetical protein
MFVKMPNEVHIYFVNCPFIRINGNRSIFRNNVVLILNREMILARNYQKRRNRSTSSVNSHDSGNLFPIALLMFLRPSTSFCIYYNNTSVNLAEREPNLIEVVNILVAYTVFGHNISNEAKSALNNIWIFA